MADREPPDLPSWLREASTPWQGERDDTGSGAAMRYVLGGALLLAVFGPLLAALIDLPALTQLAEGDAGSNLRTLITVWTTVYGVAAAVAITDTVLLVRRGDLTGLGRGAVFTKLAGIPFFVLNFVILGFLVQSTLFFGIGFILAPVFILWTYLVMLPTSAYGIGLLVALRRRRAVSPAFITGHAVLHLLFVVDVVSSLMVAARARQVRQHGPEPEPMPGR